MPSSALRSFIIVSSVLCCAHGARHNVDLSNLREAFQLASVGKGFSSDDDEQERPVLCDENLVEEACFILNGGEKHARGDDWTNSEILRDVLSATPAAMSSFWEAAGLSTDHETEDGLGYWVECEDLCAAVVEYGEENGMMPPTSDIACYNVGMETFCDLPMDPEDFTEPGPKPDEDMPDFHDGDIKKSITARTALIEAQAKKENRTGSLVSLSQELSADDVEYDIWELAERISNIFRIYPSRKPEPEEEEDEDGEGGSLAEMKSNAWPPGKERLHHQMAAKAKGYMSIVIRAINMKLTKEQMGKWFGGRAYFEKKDRKEILRVMNSVDHMISNVEPVYEGPECESNTYAYVYPHASTCRSKSELKRRACTKYNGKFVFYLCSLYLNRKGEMIETLVHEGSHHASSYTDDVDFEGGTAYGRGVCQRLARKKPALAIKNADNFCYYIQDVATQITPPKGSGSSGGRGSTVCWANTKSPAPDKDGDCKCKAGYKCFNGDDVGCPYSDSGVLGSDDYETNDLHGQATCKTCSCKPESAVPPPPPPPSPGSCFAGSQTSKPDQWGWCTCKAGLTCYNGNRKGCPWSTKSPPSNRFGYASCTACKCQGQTSKPSAPSTGSGKRCFANTIRSKPDNQGNCRCRSGYTCYNGHYQGCPWSRGSKGLTYGFASCKDCHCKSKYYSRALPSNHSKL